MLFSQKIGKKPLKKAMQLEAIDDELRNSLWTIIFEKHIERFRDPAYASGMNLGLPRIRGSNLWPFVFKVWFELLKLPSDTVPRAAKHCIEKIRNWFFKAEWYEVLDLIQISIQTFPKNYTFSIEAYLHYINPVLEKESSAYRVIGTEFVPITNEGEIRAIEEATNLPRNYKAVETHFKNALRHFSNKQNPDFPNAVKEAMCAVESLARIISGEENATLGQITEKLPIHGAMRSALSKMYGFTSDEGGIRHGAIEEVNIDFNLTKFMLVTISAFINYVISEIQS